MFLTEVATSSTKSGHVMIKRSNALSETSMIIINLT